MTDKLWYGPDEAWLSGVETRLAAAPVAPWALAAHAPDDLTRAVADLRKMEAEIERQDKLLVQHAADNERLKNLLREAVEDSSALDSSEFVDRIRRVLE